MRYVVFITLCFSAAAAATTFPRGLYFDPARVGHGLALERVGAQFVLVFYTYNPQGAPEWYLSVADVQGNSNKGDTITGSLQRFNYAADRFPPQQLEREVGGFTLRADGDCGNRLEFVWEIDGSSARWCVQSLLGDNRPAEDFGGLWYAGVDDQGWGLTLDFASDGDLNTVASVLFYFDAAGQPRWAIGSGPTGSTLIMQSIQGYCRRCETVTTEAIDTGRLALSLTMDGKQPAGSLELEVTYPDDPGGAWSRMGAIEPISNPAPGLIPLPAEVPASSTIVLNGVDVIPMTDNGTTLRYQDVLIENARIQAIGPTGSIRGPADATLIDARGRILIPGLSEMHLHVSVGGLSAAREAGLLMIANGITTAFNVGDGFQIQIPDLAASYLEQDAVGPVMYTANVAYGPADGSDAARTISSGAQASTYAQSLANAGYDFLKVYWQVPVLALRQFFAEGQRLGMPVIGHLPMRQSMETSMAAGQVMAVHIQEPFVTFMANQEDAELITPAADIFLRHGTYLTPTLAVFESYFEIYGGDRAKYQELISRQGSQYQPPSILAAWRSYFFSNFVQGNGQTIGFFDERFRFFKRIVRDFNDRGVPLLIGTDAPGFPGVMSGYGAIHEMRLFAEAGVPAPEILAAATRNAGAFMEETLGLEVGFGTIEAGNRADLVLLDADPRSNIENVNRRAAVLSRGHWRSTQHLQSLLDNLTASRSKSAPAEVVDPPYCADHLVEPGLDWPTP